MASQLIIAQSDLEHLADNFSSNNKKIRAIEIYKYSLAKDPNNLELMYKIGKLHYDLGEFKEALNYYKEVEKGPRSKQPKFNYEISNLYSNSGNFVMAQRAQKRFTDKISKYILDDLQFYDKTGDMKNKNTYLESILTKMEINTKYDEVMILPYGLDFLISTNSNRRKAPKKKTYLNDLMYYNVKQGKLSPFFSDLNSKWVNVNGVALLNRRSDVYVAHTNQTNDKITSIYFVKNDEVRSKVSFHQVRFAGMHDMEYSYIQPFVTKDGKRMIFSSNRPNGMGGFDLWISNILNDTMLSEPENIGPVVNTIDNEFTPYIANDMLFFSSDGHIGYGGLDNFYSNIIEFTKFSDPINLGRPINSSGNDYQLSINFKDNIAFFNSDRSDPLNIEKNNNNHNCYMLETKEFATVLQFEDVDKKAPILDVLIKNTDLNSFHYTNDNNEILIKRLNFLKYNYIAKSKGYLPQSFVLPPFVDTLKVYMVKNPDALDSFRDIVDYQYSQLVKIDPNVPKPSNFDSLMNVKINPKPDQWKAQVTGDNTVVIKDNVPKSQTKNSKNIHQNLSSDKVVIYYESKDYTLSSSNQIILDHVLTKMKKNPKLKLSILTHTDCQNPKEVNLTLSKIRTESLVEILISKGIKSNRIEGIGLGDAMPQKPCKCNSDVVSENCTPEDLSQNRRTEFIFKSSK